MDTRILSSPTEAEMSAAVHENLYALFRCMGNLPGSEVVESERLCYHFSFPTNPMFRGVWRARLPREEIDAAIEDIKSWFDQHGRQDFFWWTGPKTEPEDIVDYLYQHGFDGNELGDPGMLADLHALDEEIYVPGNLSILPVIDVKMLEHFRDVLVASYEMPASHGQAWVDATLSAGLGEAPWKMYVGYLDARPMATSVLFNGAGVAGVYGVGTLPEARRKGIGAAITLKPLLDARQQGYHYGVLYASRMGFSIYQKLGFREVASKVGIYYFEKI